MITALSIIALVLTAFCALITLAFFLLPVYSLVFMQTKTPLQDSPMQDFSPACLAGR